MKIYIDMKKLKQRIKRALFAFFREEIMREVNEHSYQEVIIKETHMELTRISKDITFDDVFQREQLMRGVPPEYLYREGIERATRNIVEEAMKYAKVSEWDEMSQRQMRGKIFNISLYVAKGK